MLCAFPFCATDVDRLLDMLEWCVHLGHQNHPSLLIADPNVPWDKAVKALDLAKKAFNSAEIVSIDHHVEGWITGSCALFKKTAIEAKVRNTHFLFMEPDAVPLKPTWMDELESSYARSGKPFMGALISHQTKGLPSPYLEGIAVYPTNAIDVMEPVWRNNQSWTLACAEAVVPLSTNTPLIKHVWGEKNKPPPVFAESNVPGTHIFCLRNIPPEAVIWHRCKDSSLIRLLRKRQGVRSCSSEIMVLFAFCFKDDGLMQNSLHWLNLMHGQLDRTAVLHFDINVNKTRLQWIRQMAEKAFTKVITHSYPTPRSPYVGWPAAPNYAFQNACRFMRSYEHPWLFFEGDAVAMKPDWITGIENEYSIGGKPFMGTVVGGMGHMNGVAVYPPNVEDYTKEAMRCTKVAFDMAMANEVAPHRHKANHIIYHCRAQAPDGSCVDAHGKPPTYKSIQEVDTISPSVCLFHPSKDGTLVKWLIQKYRK